MNTEPESTDSYISVAELVRESESNYVYGHTQTSKYVSFNMYDTIQRIAAYLNSKHISGETDPLGREKPFFNIVKASTNVWFRATDIDRASIKIRATKSKDAIVSLMATVVVQEWMRKENYGATLNSWGRVLSRYGSAVLKFVENDEGLHIIVMPWSQLIVDPVNFYQNLKIEVLELTEAELRQRVTTMGYDADSVKGLISAAKPRETLDKKRKDNKSHYFKLYETHAVLSLATLNRAKNLPCTPEDENIFVQQMHITSTVVTKEGRKSKYNDFTVYAGQEDDDPYMLTHLIEEEDRTLSIGAVENLFEAQWMTNHNVKNIKDQLDLASRLLFQTADASFVGKNVLTDLEQGEIFQHAVAMPLTRVDNSGHDIVGSQNFAIMWKGIGNEINGISDAMLGQAPKSGTAWRQTEALLQESYSLFDLMKQNKLLYTEQMMRERIIPYLKRTKLNDAREIASLLGDNDITRIDAMYVKNAGTHNYNRRVAQELIKGNIPDEGQQQQMMTEEKAKVGETLNLMGNTRFFKPDEVDWATELKDLEWELEFDDDGESRNTQEALTTMNMVLKLIMTPGFDQNARAQAIVGRALELTGAMSPVEYNAIPASPPPAPPQPAPVAAPPAAGGAPLTP